MSLPDVDKEKFEISKELNNVEEEQKQNNTEKAKSSQKKAASKMKEMSKKMNKSMMEMDGESLQENIDDLRKILENLVLFSFEQENLLNTFSKIDGDHPNFGKNLSKQNILKTHFEHIDDSLYTLSMRLPKLSAKMDADLANTHYNLDLSLDNFAQNRFNNGLSNQQYVMTSVNNLADYLSTMLDNLKTRCKCKWVKVKANKNLVYQI
ncbi:MAG: hypothetical protein HC798_04575 [Polaribacter sp.]|nr:hypothetical protein [Polaribacter sp.]